MPSSPDAFDPDASADDVSSSDAFDDAPLPRGLVFPSLQKDTARRSRRLAFVCVLVVTAAALVWPVYPFFASSPRPLVLGLPFSFAWVILWLTVIFIALGTLYVVEEVNNN